MRYAFAWLGAIAPSVCWALTAVAGAQTCVSQTLPPAHFGVPVPEQSMPPMLTQAAEPPKLTPAQPEETDPQLPINLATALRLADARPLIIQYAAASVQTEAGRLLQAQVLWLPTLRLGIDYQRHDGAIQGASGTDLYDNGKEQFLLGAGPSAIFALADAIYEPLAQQQLLRSRQSDVQTAKNDALLAVANAFFQVQLDRGVLAGLQDAIGKARELEKRIASLGKGLVSPIEVERVRATLFDLEQSYATARQGWRVSSADLTRLLRLNPTSIVVPLEPPSLTVTLVPSGQTLDTLIPLGLTNRPELASQQAVVQAALLHLQQERIRPLIPSIVLQGISNPGDTLAGGYYGDGINHLNHWSARSDFDVQVWWEFRNLGFGNRGLVRERQGLQQQALIDLYRVQDQVAAEVVQAQALVEAATTRRRQAETGLQAALKSYAGNILGLSETVRAGDLLVLVIRPQEALAALSQLQVAYTNYYSAVADFNRAQFQLFRALGYPAQELACGDRLGTPLPVDVNRTPPLGPVETPSCAGCPK